MLDMDELRQHGDFLRYKRLLKATINTDHSCVQRNSLDHERSDPFWLIIKWRIQIPDEELIKVWPCNHLSFCYGDVTLELS